MAVQDKPFNLHQEKKKLDSFLSTITDSGTDIQGEEKVSLATGNVSEQEEHKFVSSEAVTEEAEPQKGFKEPPAIERLTEAEKEPEAAPLHAEEPAAVDYLDKAAQVQPEPEPEIAPLDLGKDISDSAPVEELKPAPVDADIQTTDEPAAPEAGQEERLISVAEDEVRPGIETSDIEDSHVGKDGLEESVQQETPEIVVAAAEILPEDKPKEESVSIREEIDKPVRQVDKEEIGFEPKAIPEVERTARLGKAVVAGQEEKPEDIEAPLVEKEEPAKKEVASSEGKAKKPFHWGTVIRAGILFAVFVVIIQGYLWMNPEIGEQAVHSLIQNVPGMDKVFDVEQAKRDTSTESIKFSNVRQRTVSNVFLGNLRIVEGVAVNSALYPVAKIRVMAELYDDKNKVVATRVSYCGNVISDEKLTSLNEEEIKSALSIPQGSDLSNNRIAPGGRIPFMIVFAREPAGVTKTTIMTLSADRIAP